jgi:DNA repair exonuclease SbcCD ATPase subunit
MKKIFLSAIVLAPVLAFAQSQTPDPQTLAALKELEQRVAIAERRARESATALQALKQEFKGANNKLATTVTGVLAASDEQAMRLQSLTQGQEALEQGQVVLEERVSQESQRAIVSVISLQKAFDSRTATFIGFLGAGFLVLLAVATFNFQRQRAVVNAHDRLAMRFDDIARSSRASEERAAMADTSISGSLLEVFVNMKEKITNTPATTAEFNKQVEPDHNLPSKLADEIHRMRKRLSTLPEDTKGLTALKKSLERLEAELAAYGYEIVDHTGKAYSDNMSIKARFIPSEGLSADERVISKVVVPQLNHQGVMVRMADVEVSIGS